MLTRVSVFAIVAALSAASSQGQQILTDLGERVTGVQTVAAQAAGASAVAYVLDGKRIATAPVEHDRAQADIDFGVVPFPRTLTLMALDSHGQALGEQRQQVNAGGRAQYLEVLEPVAYAGAGAGARVVACAHLGDEPLKDASFTIGDTSYPLTGFADRRCAGTALRGELPKSEALYLEAHATTASGAVLTDTLALPRRSGALGFEGKITVRLLQYLVRPIDGAGKPVLDVAAPSFRVAEDRRELAVQHVGFVSDAPLDVAIVIDASSTMSGDEAMKDALAQSALDLLDPAKDRAIVYAIGNYPEPILREWTSDRERIRAALRTATHLAPRPRTAAYDTLEEVLYRLQSSTRDGTAAGAVLYMTDGDDTVTDPLATERREDTLLRYAKGSGVQVYPISVALPLPPGAEPQCGLVGHNRVNGRYLESLARTTGGEYTALEIQGNPAPFLRKAEALATELKRLRDTRSEDSIKEAQRRERCLPIYVEQYRRHLAQSRREEPLAERIRDAVARAGVSLRSQYVVAFQAQEDGVPHERTLSFFVADPRVTSVKAPTGTYY